MDDKKQQEERIEARWCYDSETGEKFLIDLQTGQVIAKWINSEDQDDGN